MSQLTVLPLVVAIPTKNEAENIARTVASVVDHVAAVVVVDSHSTDDTCAIAAAGGAEVVAYTWDGRYPKKKQWCLEHVRPDIPWLLFLDGDETPSPELLAELRAVFADGPPRAAAFDIPLGYWFAGRRLRHGYTIVKRALLDRTRCHFPEVGDLDGTAWANRRATTSRWRRPCGGCAPPSSTRTSTRSAPGSSGTTATRTGRRGWRSNRGEGADPRVKSRQGQIFHKAPFKPLLSFAYAYVYKRGFLDGRAGFDYALAMSFYRWQIALKSREAARG